MTSSMLTGEKRWASTRRGGMTVLGKVAVPKPINLPSQRLENHGLDPNVEIVPKGTHSWGSRSSSSSSNAWGSASPSPNTDGDTGSPSHLNGRPSSGGTGTRPSTAGSERGHDPIPNAWGSNSRPSSSSGALSSSQTSHAVLRPRSAETRPGSSQLSRFAEPLPDSSGAWGGTGTTEKLGVTTSKNDGFSLSSGDFPTLGSEKDNSGKNLESQECGSLGRPVSSGGVASGKERIRDSAGDVSANISANTGGAGSWRRENSMYGEDGARSNEKWHHDPQSFTNSNIPPQHFDGWHGPPVNNHPSAVWYRGPPPGGPPFANPIPGGFPMEAFPYYHPQIPPHAIVNPPHVAPGGTGPRGPHPKNGDMYRPQMHDAYMRPAMHVRPGFYPGTVPFDEYYGHHTMGYCNPNEQDAQFMGMAMGPSAYNRFPSQHVVDPGNSNGRTSGFGPGSKAMVSEQAHSQDPRGPYRVLLKQHDGWDVKDEQKWDDSVKTNVKGEHPRKLSRENDWRADKKEHDEIDTRRMVIGGASSEGLNIQVVPMKVKSPESIPNVKAYDGNSGNKLEHAASNFPEVLAAPKDSSLIQKIEGLNAKARASDGRPYAKYASSGEELKYKSQVSNTMNSHPSNEVGNDTSSREKAHINPVPHEDNFSAEDRGVVESAVSSGTSVSRRSTQDAHGRVDRVKGRFNTHESDGWKKKPQDVDTRNIASTARSETSSHSHRQHHISAEAGQTSLSQPFGNDDVESVLPVSDPSDNQRVKMRELTKRRLKEREKEEEERTREQRAKALAKLEELNRRTQTAEGATQKSENVLSSTIQNKKNESVDLIQPIAAANRSGLPNSSSKSNTFAQSRDEESTTALPIVVTGKSKSSSSALDFSPRMVVPNNGSSLNIVDKSTSVGGNVLLDASKISQKDSAEVHEQLNSFQQDANNVDAGPRSSTQRVHDISGSKQKRAGFRQKQNASEKNASEKLPPSSLSEGSKVQSDIARDAARPSDGVADAPMLNPDSNLPVNLSVLAESSTHHKKKSRSSKSKHKLEDAPTALDSLVASAKPRTPETMSDPNAAHSQNDSKDANQSSELCQSLANEEAHIRANNQWKSHHSRRLTKNSQGNKSVEKNQSGDAVVWAPVRLQNKTKVFEETCQNNAVEAVLTSKSDQQVQNNPRNKRAEMERYIPKPVAKELSQQVVGTLSYQFSLDEIVERPRSTGAESSRTSGAAAGKTVPNIESTNGDGRQNKSGKVHGGAWRQRGGPESSASPRSSQNSTEDQHHKADRCNMKEQPKYHDEWDDGWNMPENPDTAVSVPALKDQSVTARGKRQSHKGNRTSGDNHIPDEKRTGGRDTERVYVDPTAPEMHQIESSVASKENHAVGEPSTSQWQPKSQTFPASNHRGNRPNSSGNVGSEGGRTSKKDSSQGGGLLPEPERDSIRARSHHGKSLSEKNNFDEAPSVGYQERKRERKMGGQRGRPGSPHESSSHLNVDARQDQHISSEFRKSGNQNNRSGRDHDSQGDWNGSGKDNKHQHNAPSNRERPRHSSHYEYQPVGPHNNNKMGKLEPPKEGSHSSGGRHRERGQTRRGGGNFQGRQTGSVQVEGGGYE